RLLQHEFARRFESTGNQEIDFRGAEKARILDDVLSIVESDTGEGRLTEVAHGASVPGADHGGVWFVLFEHAPHRVDVVAGEAPVAARVEIAEPDFLGHAK